MTCIPSDQDCPVVAIKVATSSPGAGWTQAPGTIVGSKNNLYFSMEQPGKIPTGNLYMSYASPCVVPSEKGGYSRQFYKLERKKYTTGCDTKIAGTKQDTRYVELTYVDESRLYAENGVIMAMNSLPGYSSTVHTGNSHKVWYRNYIKWDINCEWDSGKDR